MHFTSITAAAVLASVVQAVEVFPVLVGMSANGTVGTFFSPDRVTVPVGSVVQFQFMGGNHSVTQSTFDAACIPISTTNTSAVGFHSGFVPAAASMQRGQVAFFNVQVNDTRPMWLYCAQGRHCQSGMVMVINENTQANASRSLESHRTIAAAVQAAGVPTINGGNALGGQTGTADQPGQSNQPGAAAGLHVPIALLAAVAGAAMLI